MPANRSVENILADARHVLAQAQAHSAQFKTADRGKKIKALPPALLKSFASDIQALDKASSGQTTNRDALKTATQTERAARTILYNALRSIRDEIRASYYAEPAVDRAFGTGTQLRPSSTPGLLNAAGAVLAAYAKPTYAKKAKDAGITPKRISDLRAARQVLASADTSQARSIGARRTATGALRRLSRRVEKTTARIRHVAGIVLGPAAADFKRTTPAARSRKKKARAPLKSAGARVVNGSNAAAAGSAIPST